MPIIEEKSLDHLRTCYYYGRQENLRQGNQIDRVLGRLPSCDRSPDRPRRRLRSLQGCASRPCADRGTQTVTGERPRRQPRPGSPRSIPV